MRSLLGSARRTARRGFTLIELMVVIVLLGLLVGMVGPKVWHMLGMGTRGAAETQMKNLSDAVEAYYLERRSLPQGLDQLTEVSPKTGQAVMDRIPLDPWKQPYEYKIIDAGKKVFVITSAGEDKNWGTEDDLQWPPKDDR